MSEVEGQEEFSYEEPDFKDKGLTEVGLIVVAVLVAVAAVIIILFLTDNI